MAVLASAYDFGMGEGYAESRPTRGVRRNLERGSDVRVTHERKLQKHIGFLSPWIANFVAVLYLTGFRIGDVLALKWDQLGPKGMQVVEGRTGFCTLRDIRRFFVTTWITPGATQRTAPSGTEHPSK